MHPSGPSSLEVVQFGTGRFLRGFFDWLVERARREGRIHGKVAVVKNTAGDFALPESAWTEGFPVVVRGTWHGRTVERTDWVYSVGRRVHPDHDYRAFLELAHAESLRLVVSNTTEAGLRYEPTEVPHERAPASFPARLTELLYERWNRFRGRRGSGVTVLPLELIADGGRSLREIVLRHARDWERTPEFLEWLQEENRFVDTLVDRIVTSPTDADRRRYAEGGVGAHPCLTIAEPTLRLCLSGEGAREVEALLADPHAEVITLEDLAAERSRKLHLLNAPHSAMAALGPLAGIETVLEFVEHPRLGPFLRRTVEEEWRVLLGPGTETQRAVESAFDRFANPFLRHALRDIALSSAAKWSVRVLPLLAAQAERHGAVAPRSTLLLAAFLRRVEELGEHGFLEQGYGGPHDFARWSPGAGRAEDLRGEGRPWSECTHRDPQFARRLEQALARWRTANAEDVLLAEREVTR